MNTLKAGSRILWHTGDNPKNDGFYLVTTNTGLVRIGRYYAIYDKWEIVSSAMAWAELPAPYSRGQEDGSAN